MCDRVSKGVALVCETRTGHELESRRGGREGEVLGRRRVVEWKLKKKEGVSSPAQRRQRICCCLWLSSGLTPRARSQHQWETAKKVGSEWGVGLAGCQIREAQQLACERGSERYSLVPTYPSSYVTKYRLCSTLGHDRPRREDKVCSWNGTEPDRTERGSTFSANWPLASHFPTRGFLSIRYYTTTTAALLPELFVGRKHLHVARASVTLRTSTAEGT